MEKAIPHKSYGSIPYLMADDFPEGMRRICTQKVKTRDQRIFVSEKLDGSNVAVLKQGTSLIPITRKGNYAHSSPFSNHQRFTVWVHRNESLISNVLRDGERLVGEWLYEVVGTHYHLPHSPFVVLDIMWDGHNRMKQAELLPRLGGMFPLPAKLNPGTAPMPLDEAMEALNVRGFHGAERAEGVVYRVENHKGVQFMAKHVRFGFEAGKHLKDGIVNKGPWPCEGGPSEYVPRSG